MTATDRTNTPVSRNSHARPRPFHCWRHSRPFWGGLLLFLAGLELLAIPLSGVLIKGQVKMAIYIGIGGVFGAGIGALLIAAGIAVWGNPAHRVFYGIAGIVLGIASFPASNLGGFFLGMLLAITGGALAFAWTPSRAGPRAFLPEPGSRPVAFAVLPCVLGLLCMTPAPSPAPSASSGSPSPSPPRVSGLPSSPLPPGSLMHPAEGKGRSKNSANTAVKQAGLAVPGATSVLSAKSSTMTKLNFAGLATLPVGGGGTEKALKFTAGSATLSRVSITVTQGGKTVLTKTASLSLPDGMTLYTTKLCGQVEGIAPDICFTPSTAGEVALKLASILGRVTPITMTHVAASQFVNLAPTARWGPLAMGAA